MGINVLKLVASKLEFVPDPKAVEEVKTFLSLTFPQAPISFKLWDNLQFVDNAGFFERICCPKCRGGIDLDWWGASMSSKWNNELKGFENLDIEAPCCGFKTSLNELEYVSPACFGLCAIEVEGAPRDLTPEELQRLEQGLSCSLRKVWARY
jgi:hypothetical protein